MPSHISGLIDLTVLGPPPQSKRLSCAYVRDCHRQASQSSILANRANQGARAMLSLEDRIQKLEDIEAINALKARYCAFCDDAYVPDGIA